ncbi:hypothetical protein [Desulfoluna spongiiphila]|uniref:Uncharacterized protein n=1 Tax=Desulfoluna spongiiphila TaxID=419481 RepID=A0A1G5GLC8_9BACT|nr:hypothetical protein [Desulfoluna spongiiphila]SCY51488.1 hypothetical protein SAMN05216233_110196 [Desulfoluna spongiiphila]
MRRGAPLSLPFLLFLYVKQVLMTSLSLGKLSRHIDTLVTRFHI